MPKKKTKPSEVSAEQEEKAKDSNELANEKRLEQELAEKNDQLLRVAAEYDNFRKRTQAEKEKIYSDAKAAVVTEILPVIDNFERAVASTSENIEDCQKGTEMIYKQFMDIFGNFGAEAFGAPGEKFDPEIHNAVLHTDDETKGENEITEVLVKGYRIGDRVIRPAMVAVAN